MNTLKYNQVLPISLREAWDFFSNPKNLRTITPEYMGFIITSELNTEKMYPGMIITYKVNPLLGIPLQWVTEITHVIDSYYFVDNQKAGPFKFWHHQHFFTENRLGTEITDILNYAAPFGWIGLAAEKIMVNKRVTEIFDYRREKLKQIFNG